MSQAHVSLGLIVTMTTTAVQCQPKNARVFGRCGNSHMTVYRGIPMANCSKASVFRATKTRELSTDERHERNRYRPDPIERMRRGERPTLDWTRRACSLATLTFRNLQSTTWLFSCEWWGMQTDSPMRCIPRSCLQFVLKRTAWSEFVYQFLSVSRGAWQRYGQILKFRFLFFGPFQIGSDTFASASQTVVHRDSCSLSSTSYRITSYSIEQTSMLRACVYLIHHCSYWRYAVRSKPRFHVYLIYFVLYTLFFMRQIRWPWSRRYPTSSSCSTIRKHIVRRSTNARCYIVGILPIPSKRL